MRAIWKWCHGARLPQRILGGEQVWESSFDFGDLKQLVRVRAAYAKTGLALSFWGCLVRYGSLRKCLISPDFHTGQFFSSSFSPINETIKSPNENENILFLCCASSACQSELFCVGMDRRTQLCTTWRGKPKKTTQSLLTRRHTVTFHVCISWHRVLQRSSKFRALCYQMPCTRPLFP